MANRMEKQPKKEREKRSLRMSARTYVYDTKHTKSILATLGTYVRAKTDKMPHFVRSAYGIGADKKLRDHQTVEHIDFEQNFGDAEALT